MKNSLIFFTISLLVFGCKKVEETYNVDTTSEMAQQIGDSLASADEAGGTTNGAFSYNEFEASKKTFARLSGQETVNKTVFYSVLIPEAQAAACNTIGFTTCASSKMTKTFGGCSLGLGGSVTGDITLTFSSGTCSMGTNGNTVTRVPNFSITGLRGATFDVTAISGGQTISRGAGSDFSFTNAGIKRKFTTPKGTVLLDLTTTTSSAITISGASRTSRTMSGGGLVVADNLTSQSCTFTPTTSVMWGSATCNCPTSGRWDASCTDGKTFRIDFGSTCGQATITANSSSSTLTLDRCQQ